MSSDETHRAVLPDAGRSAAAPWMRRVLIAAAAYNMAWGAWVVLFPISLFTWIGAEPPRYPQIWQCVGMIVGVYGVGYACAAMNPLRHWPIVLVGLLGKILGPIGFLDAALVRGTLPAAFGFTILTNDLIWWVPFSLILWRAYRAARGDHGNAPSVEGSPVTPAARPARDHRTPDTMRIDAT